MSAPLLICTDHSVKNFVKISTKLRRGELCTHTLEDGKTKLFVRVKKAPAYNIKAHVSARHAFAIVSILGVGVNPSKIKDREDDL
jgi:hypothetical protein